MRASLLLSLVICTPTFAAPPDCSGKERWPTRSAAVLLKNAGILGVAPESAKTVRLASEKVGKDLYRQVHLITFTDDTGNAVEVVTVNDASSQECSMSSVDAYVISSHLGP